MNQNESIQPEIGQAMNQNESIQPEKKLQEILSIIENQDDRIQKLQSTAFQLANYYFIFQGVIFTVISNGTSSVKCRNWWFPFILSLIAAVLNLFALLMIGIKYKRSLDQQELNWRYYEQYEKNKMEQRRDEQNSNIGKQLSRDPFTQHQRKVYLFLCVSLFVGFSVLTIFGCYWIRCRKSVHGDDDKCVKLCEPGERERCIRICPEY